MKIIDTIKKSFKKGTNLVLEEIEIHKQYNELKSQVLAKLKIDELKTICKEFNIKTSDKVLYRKHVHENISLDDLIEHFENKNKTKSISKIIKEKQIIDKQYNHHPLIQNKFQNNKIELEIKPKIDVNFKIKK